MWAILKRRNLPKKTTFEPSERNWNQSDELLILKGIVDYEHEKKLSYKSDWDAFYRYIKDFIDASFMKKQLIGKVRKLKKRFIDYPVRSNDARGPPFANSGEDRVFNLSFIIWATKKETKSQCGSNEILDQVKDLPNVEHESVRSNSMKIDNGDKEESEEVCSALRRYSFSKSRWKSTET
ncbi:hypothetical protein AALP_AAs56852U000100 [Arabis alpina]|uniref:Glabrous enhancer-binding protein-like DBD domain-containing protein n=1 Tax=Arabis alpina TaxID=50452 RepID=A0A087FX43_ARAAL|nr:hypothetical protein AALP_AAs56852U000100 [Arabis alpina]